MQKEHGSGNSPYANMITLYHCTLLALCLISFVILFRPFWSSWCTKTTLRANASVFILHSQYFVFTCLFEYFLKAWIGTLKGEQKMKSPGVQS